ncbi:DUF2577 domain-containing protein [Lactobacillus apis]|uniref:DUF2577 domain-containing protein n=1 Tax=Lactobacillus apis TaxID=303541 RepID=UPI00164F52F0|nr:DUF2577 domain-containing protein [Lactobacillus apis]MBC6360579.1 DUF2577 domain-containing protein [Lactobacillus apis]
MAGERLIKMLNSRGGKDSDYADVVYGVVTSTEPLKVQLSNNMVIDDNFIVLGRHIGKYNVTGKGEVNGQKVSFKGLEIDNSLKKNDKVTMIRMDGGQQFYLFEREEE